MPDIDSLPIRYEAYGITPHPEGARVMMAMETDQGPVAVHMDRSAFEHFVQLANAALARKQLPNQPQ